MGVALAVTSTLMGMYSQNQALIEQGKVNQQNARNYVTTMNYNFQNLEQQRHDIFESTVDELEKDKLQGHRLEAQVAAAVNEGLEGGGRTADLLKRAAQADTNRATAQVKANYKKQSNEMDLNKETALLQAKQGIASIQDVKKPSLFGTLFGIASSYYTGKTNELQLSLMRKNAGLDANGSDGYRVVAPSSVSQTQKTTNWNSYFDKDGNLDLDKYLS